MDNNSLFFSLLFSVVGMGYFAYGRKNNVYFLGAGLILMIFPYFISTFWPLLGLGLGAMIIPFVLNWWNPL